MSHPNAGDVVAGRYQVVRVIREAGPEAFLEVEDRATRRRRMLVRVEGLDAAAQERFVRDAFRSSELEAPHVLEVVDAGVDPETRAAWLTAQLPRGGFLDERIGREGSLARADVVAILVTVARALDAMHARGIVHGRLSPGLVGLDQADGDERAKLLVLARVEPDEGDAPYLSPEQLQGRGHPQPANDLWPLGLIAYEALVGARFWEAASTSALLKEILLEPIASPVARAAARSIALPPAFEGWFARTVVRDPAARFATAGEAVAALADALAVPLDGPRTATPPKVVPDGPPIDAPVLVGNPKGSFYDRGLVRGPEKPIEPPLLPGNPKGSFYDGGLVEERAPPRPPRGAAIPLAVGLALAVAIVAGLWFVVGR